MKKNIFNYGGYTLLLLFSLIGCEKQRDCDNLKDIYDTTRYFTVQEVSDYFVCKGKEHIETYHRFDYIHVTGYLDESFTIITNDDGGWLYLKDVAGTIENPRLDIPNLAIQIVNKPEDVIYSNFRGKRVFLTSPIMWDDLDGDQFCAYFYTYYLDTIPEIEFFGK